MNIVTLSTNNQIAIPSYLLHDLDFGPGNKLIIQKMGNKISLEPMKKSVVDSVSGSLLHLIPSNKRGTSWEKIIAIAKTAKAHEKAHN